MKWYVFYQDTNNQEITKFNIFQHRPFKQSVEELLVYNITKEEFAEQLAHKLRYYFWRRCEYEIVITSGPLYLTKETLIEANKNYLKDCEKWGREPYRISIAPDVAKKVDIYEQIMLNWETFVDYIWMFKK